MNNEQPVVYPIRSRNCEKCKHAIVIREANRKLHTVHWYCEKGYATGKVRNSGLVRPAINRTTCTAWEQL